MRCPLEVLIISSSTIYGAALQQWLEAGQPLCHCQIVIGTDVARSPLPREPDAALIDAVDWRQLAGWLPVLRRELSTTPWVILADLRLIGMFLKILTDQPCVAVDPNEEPERLRAALQAAAEHQCSPVAFELRSCFVRTLDQPPHGRPHLQFTDVELQCGCGVSLGLTNREIAAVLCVTEATVKSHLHRFMRRLGIRKRRELGELVARAFLPVEAGNSESNRKGGVRRPVRYRNEANGSGPAGGRAAPQRS